MFLAAYHFDGDPAALVAAYERLRRHIPIDPHGVHLCAVGQTGIVVVDGCPGRAEFLAFSTGPDFRDALAAAGLPVPRIEPLGDRHEVAATVGGRG
jgi:hypothetical protein